MNKHFLKTLHDILQKTAKELTDADICQLNYCCGMLMGENFKYRQALQTVAESECRACGDEDCPRDKACAAAVKALESDL